MKTKKIRKITEYRILKSQDNFSVIQVFLNSKEKIIGYTDYIIPTAKTRLDLKLMLSAMLQGCRKDSLTEEDLKSIKK